jgi:hypothetical protein
LDLRGKKWWEAGEDCIMWSLITCVLYVKDEMGRAYSMYGRDGKSYTILVGKPEGKRPLRQLKD